MKKLGTRAIVSLFKNSKFSTKITFFVLGIGSTIWFLIRVIPKPQRASYPCMRAAAPFMSSFVVYLLSLAGASVLLKKFPKGFKSVQVSLTAMFFILALAIPGVSIIKNNNVEQSIGSQLEAPNSPVGEAKGIFPGRVVWAYNPNATDESCTNSSATSGYFLDKYTDQVEVDKMLNECMYEVTGKESIKDSWDAVFKFHNKERGKGEVGYKAGEVIFLKINRTSTYTMKSNFSHGSNNICETSPQIVTSVLRHLVNEVGVAESDIYIGDPLKRIYDNDYEKWHGEFPDVHYLDNVESKGGREKVVKSSSAIIKYSDRGEILRTGSWSSALDGDPFYDDNLYTIFEEMEYLINLPNMKGHERAGVTMFAKNHFGSHTREDAKHLHGGLVNIGGAPNRNTYGQYRVQVDLMSHELLGKKNLIFIMDALYSSEHEVNKPDKWKKAPWNNDWTSSIFVSLDPVAIESVGFDFLYYEYDGESGNGFDYPHYGAVDDYLHQAADKANWPDDISYDPEDDGSEITSLGVHEHWNNASDMQYSRNLETGNGIELVKLTPEVFTSNTMQTLETELQLEAFPNPVVSNLNVQFNLQFNANVNARIISLDGKLVETITNEDLNEGMHNFSFDASALKSGLYLIHLHCKSANKSIIKTLKFQKR